MSVSKSCDECPETLLSAEDLIGKVSTAPLVQELSGEELLNLLHSSYVVRLQADEVLFEEGSPGGNMFLLLSGELAAIKAKMALATFRPGDHFGEIAFLLARPRSVGVIAKRPSEVLAISREAFIKLAQTSPQVGVKLLWRLAGELGNRLASTNELVLDGALIRGTNVPVKKLPEL